MFAKTFRNTLIASSLLVGASLMVGQIAQAQTGDVNGSITTNARVTFAESSSISLNATDGHTGVSFGTVNVRDNSNGGWTLTVDSAGNGNLVGLDNSETIAYTQLIFDGTPGTTTPIDVSGLAAGVYDITGLTCSAEAGCDIAITADIAAAAIDGKSVDTYSDTFTFVLTSK